MATLGMFSFVAAARYRLTMAKDLVEHAARLDAASSHRLNLAEMARHVPARVYLHWAQETKETQVRATQKEHWELACLGLLVHFRALQADEGKARKGIAIPSEAALAAWRVWEKEEPGSLRVYLEDALGASDARYVGQAPDRVDGFQQGPRAFADAWVLAHTLEGIRNPQPTQDVPFVFGIDKQLFYPGGMAFFRDGSEPKAGFSCYINSAGEIHRSAPDVDTLSKLFVYELPETNTPGEAKAVRRHQEEAQAYEAEQRARPRGIVRGALNAVFGSRLKPHAPAGTSGYTGASASSAPERRSRTSSSSSTPTRSRSDSGGFLGLGLMAPAMMGIAAISESLSSRESYTSRDDSYSSRSSRCDDDRSSASVSYEAPSPTSYGNDGY